MVSTSILSPCKWLSQKSFKWWVKSNTWLLKLYLWREEASERHFTDRGRKSLGLRIWKPDFDFQLCHLSCMTMGNMLCLSWFNLPFYKTGLIIVSLPTSWNFKVQMWWFIWMYLTNYEVPYKYKSNFSHKGRTSANSIELRRKHKDQVRCCDFLGAWTRGWWTGP